MSENGRKFKILETLFKLSLQISISPLPGIATDSKILIIDFKHIPMLPVVPSLFLNQSNELTTLSIIDFNLFLIRRTTLY